MTETYVAMKLHVDNWRWAGVPFYLRTGKHLPKRTTEIAIQFKRVPHLLVPAQQRHRAEPAGPAHPAGRGHDHPHRLEDPRPGHALAFGQHGLPLRHLVRRAAADAYERLLLDAMLGDSTLFTRRDEVEKAWEIVSSILDGWQEESRYNLPTYEAGTWGPVEADQSIARDGRTWRRLIALGSVLYGLPAREATTYGRDDGSKSRMCWRARKSRSASAT